MQSTNPKVQTIDLHKSTAREAEESLCAWRDIKDPGRFAPGLQSAHRAEHAAAPHRKETSQGFFLGYLQPIFSVGNSGNSQL